jgi:ribosomal protein S18 acetylase RimI-like enzyme
MLLDYSEEHVLTPIKSLYIDDLCVDERCRGKHIGAKLFDFVKAYAREIGCYNVTLNVWACNSGALKFYEKCGMQVQKMGMETVL